MTGRLTAGTGTAAAAAVAGLVAFVLAGVGPVSTLVGATGAVALAAATAIRSRSVATAGGAGLYAAVLLAGPRTAPGTVLAAGVATLLAWTWAHTAIDLRASLGGAGSGGLEPAHVAGTTALAGGGAAAAFLAFDLEWGEVPPLAVAFLLVGAAALATSLRRRP